MHNDIDHTTHEQSPSPHDRRVCQSSGSDRKRRHSPEDTHTSPSSHSHRSRRPVRSTSPIRRSQAKQADEEQPGAAASGAMSSVSSLLEQHPYRGEPTGKEHWVFISHAGEQKRGPVAYLWERLRERYPSLEGRVFLDENSLKVGQIRPVEKIYACLQDVFVVIVWLSKEFISKRYPMEELQLLMHWQQQGSSVVVLPVWYDITREEAARVIKYYQAAVATGNCEDAAKNLPGHLSKVKAAAEAMAAEGQRDCMRQWVQDLERLLSITSFRRDQVQNEPEMRDKVVEAVVEALDKLGKTKASQPENHLRKTLKEGMLSEYEVPGLVQEYLSGSREWLLTETKEWLGRRVEGRNRLFLLLAGPGMGKSVFCAMLTQECSSDIAAHHFFKAGARSAGVKGMMCSILHQLALRLPSANRKLTQLLEALEPGQVEGFTTKECFEKLMQPVVGAVHHSEVGAHGVVVLLDALDEAEVAGRTQEVVNFLSRCLKRLPAWLRFLVSTRPELAASFKTWHPTVIEPSSKENLADLKDVIAHGLKSGGFLADGEDIEDATNVILQKSEGVFIYSKFVFEDLLKHPSKWKGSWTLPELRQQLPVGTNAMFETILNRAEEALQRSAKDQHLATPFKRVLLPVLATMMAPLSIDELSWVTKMENNEVELLIVKHLPSLFPLQLDSDGVGRARPYHKTITDLLLSASTPLPSSLNPTRAQDHAASTVDECIEGSEDEVEVPGPEQLDQLQPLSHPPSSWAVDAQAGHSQFVEASLPELEGVHMEHWQQPCLPQVPHARYVLPNIVPHLLAASAWKQLHEVLCRTLPALKALVEARQVPPLLQHLSTVLLHPMAREVLGEVAFGEIRSLLSFLIFDQQQLQSCPHQLLQEAWNSPSNCCLHSTVRSCYAVDQAPDFFWRDSVQWCNPPPTFPQEVAVFEDAGVVCTSTLTADGSRLVSGSDDGTLRVWDMSSLECVGRLQGHNGEVTTCILTADGSRLVSGSNDHTLRVWDMLSLECVGTLQGHTGEVTTCMLTAKGSRLVSGSKDHTLRVWDMSSLECVGTLQGHTWWVTTCTLTADGSRLVSGSKDHTLRVWDMSSLECVGTLQGHTRRVSTCTLIADGSRLVSGSDDGTLRVWDMSSLECVGTLQGHGWWVTTCSLTADGSRLVSGSNDHTLRVWDMSSLECVGTLQGHTGQVTTCTLTADGSRLVSGSKDHTLQVWDMSSLECVGTLQGHTGEVNTCTLMADGSRLVSGSDDCTLRVWDLSNFEHVGTQQGHTQAVTTCMVTADGSRLVSGSKDHTLRVWDMSSLECVGTLQGHTGMVSTCALTADGSRLVSGSDDGTLRLWDMSSLECVGTLQGHTWQVTSCTLTADGSRLVSGCMNGVVRVWDMSSLEYVGTLQGQTWGGVTCTLTADGSRLVSTSNKTLRVWDMSSLECVGTMQGHTGKVTTCTLTADGSRLVSGSYDCTLRVWDMSSLKCVGTLQGHAQEVIACSLTADGSWLVSGSRDNTLRVWDMSSLECVGALQGHARPVTSCTLTADGSRLVTGSEDQTLRVWDMSSLACVSTKLDDTGQVSPCTLTAERSESPASASDDHFLECVGTLQWHTRMVTSCTLTADGSRLVSGSWDHTLRVWDMSSLECVGTLQGHTGEVTTCTLTADGSRLVSGSWDNTLRVWDMSSLECVGTFQGHTREVINCCLTADGRRLVSGSSDHTLRVWDMVSLECLGTLQGHTWGVTTCTLTADGSRLVSGSNDHTLRVWDMSSMQCVCTLQGHTQTVTSCTLAADGSRLVSGSDDHTLRVWDMTSLECMATLRGHGWAVTSCTLSVDGSRLVSGSWDRSLRVWDMSRFVCMGTLQGHSGWVTTCTLTADGSRLVSGSSDHTLRVWDMSSLECVGTLQGHTGSVTACVLTVDKNRAVSGSWDGALRVWDMSSLECVGTLQGHTREVIACNLIADGSRLVSGSWDSALRAWDISYLECSSSLSSDDQVPQTQARAIVEGSSSGQVPATGAVATPGRIALCGAIRWQLGRASMLHRLVPLYHKLPLLQLVAKGAEG